MKYLLVLFLLQNPAPSATVAIPESSVREAIDRLIELKELRAQDTVLKQTIDKLNELSEREQQTIEKELQIERDRTDLQKQKTELAEQQRDFYKSLYESATKKRSCTLKKIFTLGLGRCS